MSRAWAVGLVLGLAGCGGPHQVRPLKRDVAVGLAAPAEADLVYLAMVDRFANGDPDNDGGVDLTDPHGWHGGDIQGIRDRLDHLEAMGVKTVWLTPVTAARDDKVGEWGAFHGYWLRDPWALNPRFGTVADLRGLSDDLHARGMRLVVDMVWNHTDYEAPVRSAHPEWFHQLGDIEDWNDPVQRVQGDVHGLPDLAQENPAVRAWLRASATAWVDRAGLDGLRIDAVGHMPRSFLAHMNRELDAHARSRGNPAGVWTLAEDFTGDPLALAQTVEKGGFDAIFDFALHYALVDVACRGADPLKLASTLSLDRHGPPADARVTFLDNHDLPRVGSVCGAETPEGQARRDAALLMLFVLRGTPCLTWGTEAGVLGAEEPGNRADLPWNDVGVRTPLITALSELRAAHPALHRGADRVVGAGPGYLRMVREAAGEVAVLDVVSATFDPAGLPPLDETIAVETVWWATTGVPDDDGDWIRRSNLSEAVLVGGEAAESTGVTVGAEWTVRVMLGQAEGPHSAMESRAPHRLEVVVSGAPGGGTLGLVGADPALGAWNPADAVGPVVGSEDRFEVDLQDGDVPVFKAILTRPDGTVEWSPAPDHALFLRPDLDVSRVELDWSPAPMRSAD